MGNSVDEFLRFVRGYFKTKIDPDGDQNGYLDKKQFKELINAYCDKINTTRLDNQVIASLLSCFMVINNDMIAFDEINNNANEIDKTIHFNTILNNEDNYSEDIDYFENKGNVFDSTVAHKHNTNFVKNLRQKLESSKTRSIDQDSNQKNNRTPNDDSNSGFFDEMITKDPRSLLNVRDDSKNNSVNSDNPRKLPINEIKHHLDKRESRRNISIISGSDVKND